MSVKEPYNTDWKNKVRTRIRRSDGVIVLVSKNSLTSSGQKWEIQCAKDEGKPIRGIWAYSSDRTVIAGVIPTVGVGDKFLLMLPRGSARLTAALLGNLDALVLDYAARQKLGGTSLKYFTMKQLAVLPPDRYSDADLAFIVPRVLELTYTAHDLAPWASDLGYRGPPFRWDPERRAQLRAELIGGENARQ